MRLCSLVRGARTELDIIIPYEGRLVRQHSNYNIVFVNLISQEI